MRYTVGMDNERFTVACAVALVLVGTALIKLVEWLLGVKPKPKPKPQVGLGLGLLGCVAVALFWAVVVAGFFTTR